MATLRHDRPDDNGTCIAQLRSLREPMTDHPQLPKPWHPIVDASDVEPVEMVPGLRRRTLSYGDRTMICLFEWDRDVLLPEHSHPHEQSGFVLSGRVELVIDGVRHVVPAGCSYVVRGGLVHSGRALEDSRLLDVFSPCRDEYKPRA